MAVDVQQAGLILGETQRLMRLGTISTETAAEPLNQQVSVLDLIAFARDQLVLWPVCQGLLRATSGCPEEAAVGQIVNGVLATINGQAERTRDQLAELLAALDKDAISPVFLKGSTFILEDNLQPQPWRPMCDLDFLVHRGELERTVEIARGLGYDSRTGRFSKTHDVHFPMLLRPPDVIGLEPHVKLSWAELPGFLSVQAFHDQAVSIEVRNSAGSPTIARMPSPAHRLAHLVFHAQISSHRFRRNVILLRDLLDWFHLAGRGETDIAELDAAFSSSGHQAHFRSFAAFCEQFWYPDQQRFDAMSWLQDHGGWSQKVIQVLVDPRLGRRAVLRDWVHMAGRALGSPREAARMVRSLAEPRRGDQVARLFRDLFR